MINHKLKYKNILFVHPGSKNKPSYIQNALNNLKIKFDVFFCSEFTDYYSRKENNFKKKFLEKILLPSDSYNANSNLINKVKNNKYNLIIFQKNNIIRPSTYKFIKNQNTKILAFYDDNFLKIQNLSLYLILSVNYFDYFITIYRDSLFNYYSSRFINNKCKLYLDLPSINSNLIKSNYKNTNNNTLITDRVLFIGIATQDRYLKLLDLSNHNIKIDVFGAYWDRYEFNNKNIKVVYKTIVGDDYFNILKNYKIILPLPRKENSDLLNYKCAEILGINGLLILDNNSLSFKLKLIFDNVYLYETIGELANIIKLLFTKKIKYNKKKNLHLFIKNNMFFESRLKRVIYK